MKSTSRIIPLLLASATLLHSQDAATIVSSRVIDASIPGEISDGSPSLPAPKPEPLTFEVKTSRSRRIHVVKSPEMPGLPAPAGNINVTVQLVKDPGLPDPPPPLPPLPPDDPAVLGRIAELSEAHHESQIVIVSATVYDHSRTYLRCYPSGGGDRKEVTAWSNLDFNHFSGFATYQVKGADGEVREYGLVMSLGNEVTPQRLEPQLESDSESQSPEIPKLKDLATDGPAFVITGGDTNDREAVELIAGMHNLYRVEGARMEAAYHARIKAYNERKAYLTAYPPKPKDVTIQFWKRNNPSPRGVQALEGGAQP